MICSTVAPASARGSTRAPSTSAALIAIAVSLHPLALAAACGETRTANPTERHAMNDAMSDSCLNFLDVGTGPAARRIAVRQRPGCAPCIFWLGGFKSDMQGTKAVALDDWAAANGRACIRFDYSGHGESGGDFADGTIGRWLEDSLAVFSATAQGRRFWSAHRWAAGWRCCWFASLSAAR